MDKEKREIFCIGGCAVDVISKIDHGDFLKDNIDNSNLGTVSITVGGSLRNAVECMLKLGTPCTFVSAVGKCDYETKG
jgi:sugar/nucleoside kinase (ribokinase family)